MIWKFDRPLLILMLVLFASCKKYPENKLWFSSPEKAFEGGRITLFTIDGADSLSKMNSMWDLNVAECSFELRKESKAEYIASGDFNGVINYLGNKELIINLVPEKFGFFSSTPIYNPINSNGVSNKKSDGRWDILKCTRDGQMKIRRTINGRTYEVQFN